jgi:glycosyltransferase involved in cell wall biosynthesis
MAIVVAEKSGLTWNETSWQEFQESIPQGPTALRPTVTVIIPTLNEARNLPLILPYIPMDWVDEVILVDGRSTDNTVEVARSLLPSIKIVLEKTPGKGAAMRAGYRAASSDIVIVLDADGSNDPREIPRFVTALMEGSDMVKGSRFHHSGGTTDMPRIRKWGNWAFVQMVNLLYGTSYTDLCYGYHAFWRYCLDHIDIKNVNGFEIDTSLYLKALQARLRLTEVPSFEGYRFHGYGKLRTIPDGWRVLKTIIKEYFTGDRVSEKELYLGFRGHRPVNVLNRSSSGMNLPSNEFLRMLQLVLAAGGYQRWVVPYFLQTASRMLQAASGSAVVLDGAGNVIDGFVVYEGTLHPACATEMAELVQNGLIGWAARSREPVLVHSTTQDPRWLRRAWDGAAEEPDRSAISIPIAIGEQVLAVLTLVRSQEKRFTEQELNIFKGAGIETFLNPPRPNCAAV